MPILDYEIPWSYFARVSKYVETKRIYTKVLTNHTFHLKYAADSETNTRQVVCSIYFAQIYKSKQ